MTDFGTSVRLISQCPCCGYSLQGLPPEHACPECGLAVDESTHVFRHSLRGPLGKVVYLMVILTGGAFLLVGMKLVRNGLNVIGMLLVVPIVAVGVACFAMILRRHGTLILSDRGIVAIDRRRILRSIDWVDVGDVKWSSVTGAIVVLGHDGDTLLRLSSKFLGMKWESQRFVRLAERVLESRRKHLESRGRTIDRTKCPTDS